MKEYDGPRYIVFVNPETEGRWIYCSSLSEAEECMETLTGRGCDCFITDMSGDPI